MALGILSVGFFFNFFFSLFTQPLNEKKANSRNLSLITNSRNLSLLRLVTLASLFWRLVLMVLPSLQTATYSLTCSRYLLLILPLLPSPSILAIEAILTTTTFVTGATLTKTTFVSYSLYLGYSFYEPY